MSHSPGEQQPPREAAPVTPAGEERLEQHLARLALELHEEESPQAVMERIVAAAAALVPGAQDATITRVRGKHVTSAAATDDRGRGLDALQDQTGQGPCLSTLFEQDLTLVGDLSTDERWPELAARVGEVGLRSMLCLRLYVAGDNLGALDLVSSTPGAFDEESAEIGQLFVSHAAVALAATEKMSNLRVAVASRDVIGQAKGILMERFKITADQAFALLSRVSQDTNRKLREVADELATTGHLRRPTQR
ncbi:GAF and ANTAR domain-containing protein [Kineococcus radiotolerans]|uniref:Response regulator receiver and ANTAR domain protein n=1 Tax=Kineococcus radiotolerans (strain ATCC BAA-149 / DSM 14245 / SRS30216) TaxID=266940 RepID=A6W9K2_KINRD|nr:GAF and ANTAR domain-containing protein [Kineococcus radiotolerans]ABS03491.1 response regulator receiver and ANTAR domain protein [Kineococcus radiotolerans SRS30216 = ATCC BAA-149]